MNDFGDLCIDVGEMRLLSNKIEFQISLCDGLIR